MLVTLGRGMAPKSSSISSYSPPVVDYYVILLAGQSNMVGRNGPIDTVLDATDPRIFMLSRTEEITGDASQEAVILAVDPLSHVGASANTIGMGLTYAKQVLTTLPATAKILLVPVAEGSSGFGDDWNIGDENFEDMIARGNAAMALGNNRLHSIAWHQGEAQGGQSETLYANRMDTLITMARDRIAGASITTPFICGDLIGTSNAAGVRSALSNIINRVPYAGFAPSTSLIDGGDGVHFDAPSLRIFGQRYFNALNTSLSDDLGLSAPGSAMISASNDEPAQSTITVTPGILGGSTIRHIIVQYKSSSSNTWIDFNREADPSLNIVVDNLTNDESYDFRVQIVTSAGISGYSNIAVGTPMAAISGSALDTNHVIDYSAQDTTSYTSGQTLTDLKGTVDAWFGNDGTAETTNDPALIGTAGDSNAFFTMGGRYFTLKSNPDLIAKMHRSDGAPWTITMQVNITSGDLPVMGTGVVGVDAGIHFEIIRSVRRLRMKVLSAGGSTRESLELSAEAIGAGDQMFSFGYDPTNGDWVYKIQGGTFQNGNIGTLNNTDATPNNFRIGTNGGGVGGGNISNIKNFAVANKLLSETEMNDVQTIMLGRVS